MYYQRKSIAVFEIKVLFSAPAGCKKMYHKNSICSCGNHYINILKFNVIKLGVLSAEIAVFKIEVLLSAPARCKYMYHKKNQFVPVFITISPL